MAQAVILVTQIYLALGVVFALVYLTIGIGRISPNSRGSSPLFRALILPGTAVLWPLVLTLWIRRGATS